MLLYTSQNSLKESQHQTWGLQQNDVCLLTLGAVQISLVNLKLQCNFRQSNQPYCVHSNMLLCKYHNGAHHFHYCTYCHVKLISLITCEHT